MRCSRPLLPFALLLLLAASLSAATSATTANDITINGDPLRITVANNLAMRVDRNEGGTFNPQYYSTYNTHLRCQTASATTVYSSGSFSAVQNTVSDDSLSITTSATCGDQLLIQQRITYVDGTQQFTQRWTVTNQGQTTYTGVALRYGGDTYFANSDSASGYYDGNTGLVYCTNYNPQTGTADADGLMGMQPALDSPADAYYEAYYGTVTTALNDVVLDSLLNTVDHNFIDNGMALQWKRDTLAPGDSFTITMFQKWTSAGTVQVLAPTARNATAGVAIALPFTVQNLLANIETITLAATIPAGWSSTLPTSITLPAQSATTVTVSVTAPSDAAGTTGQVRLTATTSGTSAATNTDVVDITVVASDAPSIAPPAATTPAAGTAVTLTYVLSNPRQVANIVDLTYAAPNGWIIDGPSSISLPASGSATVAVVVRVPVTATSSPASVQLTATSRTTGGSTTATAMVTPGAAAYRDVQVSLPAIPFSTDSDIFTGICPSTPEGLARLRAALATPDPTRYRAFAWDATTQAYVELPTEPSGGLQISAGVFLATRVNLGLDFSGSAAEAPVILTLAPGWNLVGIPPAGTSEGVLTSHACYADFTIKDTDGSTVDQTSARFADLLGRVGSNDATTARPWKWTGSTYVQVDTLTSGQGVWFKNNATAAIALWREAPGLNNRRAVAAKLVTTAPSPVVDRGTPPGMPAAAPAHDRAEGGAGCGSGSGLGMLLFTVGLVMTVRLRRRA